MNPLPIRLALASFLTISLAVAGRASAALILVTAKNDVVADDGRCSLREAVSAANQNKASGRKAGECATGDRTFVDVIQLRRATYQLKRAPIGEDQNVGGDLDVSESLIIQGKGPRTVIQNAIGDPETFGDGDRLFHVDPRATGGVNVKFSRLTLARGDVGCSGRNCTTGGSAVDARGSGSLTLERCTVMRNAATCSGESCGSSFDGAAIQTLFGGALTIQKSTIKKNQTGCSGDGCGIGGAAISMTTDGGADLVPGTVAPTSGDFSIDESTVTQNVSSCEGKGCHVGGIVDVTGATVAAGRLQVTSNGTLCYGDRCSTSDVVDLYGNGASALVDDVDVADNYGECSGDDCFLGSVLTVSSDGNAALRSARLRNNDFTCQGAGCIVTIHYGAGAGADATVENVAVTDDEVTCRGVGCAVYGLLGGESGGAMNVIDVTVDENQISCEEAECAVGVAAGWSGAPVRTLRHGVSGNLSGCTGERCQVAPLLTLTSLGDTSFDEGAIRGNFFVCGGDRCRIGEAFFASVEDGALALEKTALEENALGCGGTSCTTSALIAASATGSLALDQPRLASNTIGCEGESCSTGGLGALQAAQVTIDFGVVTGNTTSCSGSACKVPAILQLAGSDGAISRSLVESNASQCNGEDCTAGPGGALHNSVARLAVVDTTLTSNQSDGYGGAIFNDAGSDLLLERAFLADNQTGLRGTMEFGGFGGAIYNDAASGARGVLTLVDSQISRNRAFRTGGGILNEGTIASVLRSVVAGNATGDCVNQGGSGCP